MSAFSQSPETSPSYQLSLKTMTATLRWQPGPSAPSGPSPPVHWFAVMVPNWIIFHCGQLPFKKSGNTIAVTKQNIVLCDLFCLLSAAISVKRSGLSDLQKNWGLQFYLEILGLAGRKPVDIKGRIRTTNSSDWVSSLVIQAVYTAVKKEKIETWFASLYFWFTRPSNHRGRIWAIWECALEAPNALYWSLLECYKVFLF